MSSSRFFIAIGAAAIAIGGFSRSGPTVKAQATLEVIASGLANPRGLAFGPEGALYVAEAGTGGTTPCVTATACYGATGAITRIADVDSPTQSRFVSGLPSLAPPPSSTTPPAGSGALGAHDIGFLGRGNMWVTIGFGNNPALRANLGSVGSQFAHLLRVLPNGRIEFAEDLGEYEADENPDGGADDSNPFGIAVLPSRTLYTDAGGNALNQVDKNGGISTLAVFPDRNVTHPLSGATVPMQAVPTTVVQGPDGALYVGQLTGFPFVVGSANVYRVPPDGGTPTVFATGFTNIIDIAFGPDGSLYVLSLDADSLFGPVGPGTAGSLIRIAPGGTRSTIAGGATFTTPGGVAIADDGRIYVTLFSTSPTLGRVVPVNP